MSEKAQRRIEECLSKKLTKLDLSDCQITDLNQLPDLKKCTHITNLNMSSSIIKNTPNQITDLTPLSWLTNLTDLDLSSNQITELTPLAGLTKMTRLWLGQNQITDLTPLKGMTELSILWLQDNQITELIQLSWLTSLTILRLGGNQISNLTPLAGLTKLTKLDLSNNQITDLTQLVGLTSLTLLDLSSNQIQDLTPLAGLTKMTTLWLGQNQITELTPLAGLTNLTGLSLSDNQITELTPLAGLTNLTGLHLTINDNPVIREYGFELEELENHREFIAELIEQINSGEMEEIKLPVKTIVMGNHATGKSSLLNYFNSEQLDYEAKSTHIISISDYTFKKDKFTNLPNAIVYDFGGQDYYHGLYNMFLSPGSLYLLCWCIKSNNMKISDTDANGHKTQNFTVEYWLKQKRYWERQNNQEQSDKLLLLQTHGDIEKETYLNIDRTVCPIIFRDCVSLENGNDQNLNLKRLDLLKRQYEFRTELLTRNVKRAKYFVPFLKKLMNERRKDKFIVSTEDLIKLYQTKKSKKGIDWERSLQINLIQLHRQGLILYFPEINENKVILNPEKFGKFLHDKVFPLEGLKNKAGIYKKEELDIGEDEDFIISVLLKMNIIINVQNENEELIIIPGFLPIDNEEVKEKMENYTLRFSLKFKEFIPFGLMNLIYQHFGNNLKLGNIWRYNIAFRHNYHILENGKSVNKNMNYLISLNFENLEINVICDKPEIADEKEYTEYIFYCLLGMYWQQILCEFEDFIKLKTAEWHYVPKVNFFNEFYSKNSKYHPEDLFVSLNGDAFVKFTHLMNIEPTNVISKYTKDDIINGKESTGNIPTKGFELFTKREVSTNMVNVFISYATDDDKYRKLFHQANAQLNREKKVKFWDAEVIITGTKWKEGIKNALKESDIVVLLMSASFIASDFIFNNEIIPTFKRLNEKNVKIFPILLEDCTWKDYKIPVVEDCDFNNPEHYISFSDYQMSPKDGGKLKPVYDWDKKEPKAWQQIADKLREEVERILNVNR